MTCFPPRAPILAGPHDGTPARTVKRCICATNRIARALNLRLSWASARILAALAGPENAQHDGGNERLRLFRVDLDQPLTLTPLTGDRPNDFLRGALHPNGRWLFYGANVDAASGGENFPLRFGRLR
jgi:hypothetical protein